MPLYMHQWTYKDGQIKQMLDNLDDLNRADVVRTATEAFGGTLRHFFYCFGEFDGVAITDFPDEVTALACVLSIFGQGRINAVRTTPLFGPEIGVQAILHAQETLGLLPRQVPASKGA